MTLRRRTRGVAVGAALVAVLVLTLPGQAGANHVAYPTQSLTRAVKRTSNGASIGTAVINLTTRETDGLAVIPPTQLTLPKGTWKLRSCLNTIPTTAIAASNCPEITVTTTAASTKKNAPQATVTAYRNLNGSPVTVSGFADARQLVNGSYTLYATSWTGLAGSSMALAPVGPPLAQLRGANTLLFKPEVTLADEVLELDALKAAGGDIVRTSFPWALLQPNNANEWDPVAVAEADGFLQLTQARGIKVLMLFGSTPCWASAAPASVKDGCKPEKPWGAYPPANYADLDRAAAWVADRWGAQIHGVEVRNEPNNTQFFLGTPADYAQIVRTTYTAFKREAPAVPVLAGALALSDGNYLTQLYANGIKGFFDAISVHPYNVRFDTELTGTGDPTIPWAETYKMNAFGLGVRWIHEIMTANGDGTKPIWLTEFGFSNCTAASALCTTDAQQTLWLKDSFRMAARWPYVTVAIMFTMRDTGTDPTVWTQHFGLLTNSFAQKEVYGGFRDVLACLDAATC